MELGLFNFPSFIGLEQLAESMVFLALLDFFYLCMNSFVVGDSLHIAYYTQCNREVRSFHQCQFKVQCGVLAMCVMNKNVFLGNAILANLYNL